MRISTTIGRGQVARRNRTVEAPPALLEQVSRWVVARFALRALALANEQIDWMAGLPHEYPDPVIVERHLVRRQAQEWIAQADGLEWPARRFLFDMTGWRYEDLFLALPREVQTWLRGVDRVAGPIKVATVEATNKADSLPYMSVSGGQVRASWSPAIRRLDVLLPVPSMHIDVLQEQASELRSMVRHELQHAAQDVLQALTQADAGEPSYRLPVNPWAPTSHALLDHEFTTRLQDEIEDFRRAAAKMPRPMRKAALRTWIDEEGAAATAWIAMSGRGKSFRVEPRRFFWDLKVHAPGRWREAARVLVAEVGDLL